jgi:PKD repeat protein
MKRIFVGVLSFIFLIGVATSCTKNKVEIEEIEESYNRPFAAYEIEATDDPFTFNFINESKNVESVEWRFGDDSLSYELSPTHQYMTPGNFEVNLKVVSPDGSTARKLLVIKVEADSLANFTADGTGEDNTVLFKASTKFPVKSIEWNFGDKTTSTELEPVKVYDSNFIGTAQAVITAENGSVVTINRSVTNHGTASSLFVDVPGSFDIEWQSRTSEGELYEKIYDGLTSTKFLSTFGGDNPPIRMSWSPDVPVVADFYTITSANDAPERDPKAWVLEGSMDGQNYVELDRRSNEQFKARFETKLYTFSNTVAYKYYRLHITEKFGSGSLLQIAEWTMYKKQ